MNLFDGRLRRHPDPLPVLDPTEGRCPGCGHDRNVSSVSSVTHPDGTCECQLCGARWIESAKIVCSCPECAPQYHYGEHA